MPELTGIEGVCGGTLVCVQAFSVSGTVAALSCNRAVAGEGDYGAWHVYMRAHTPMLPESGAEPHEGGQAAIDIDALAENMAYDVQHALKGHHDEGRREAVCEIVLHRLLKAALAPSNQPTSEASADLAGDGE